MHHMSWLQVRAMGLVALVAITVATGRDWGNAMFAKSTPTSGKTAASTLGALWTKNGMTRMIPMTVVKMDQEVGATTKKLIMANATKPGRFNWPPSVMNWHMWCTA
jgi:hypothetical protein